VLTRNDNHLKDFNKIENNFHSQSQNINNNGKGGSWTTKSLNQKAFSDIQTSSSVHQIDKK
jgi:hypothetical protein